MVNQLVAAEGVALPKHEKLQLRLFKVQPCKITTNKFPDSFSASDEALKKTSKLHPLLSLYIFSCVLFFIFFIFFCFFNLFVGVRLFLVKIFHQRDGFHMSL